jgi:hypothetical protein
VTDANHNRHLVVWDVPSAVECGEPFEIRVGIKCEQGCDPHAWPLEIRDHSGRALLTAAPMARPWPDTEALYGLTAKLAAPEVEGLFAWEVFAPAAATAANESAGTDEASADESRHAEINAPFSIRTVASADCRLTVIAVDRETQDPVPGATVLVHPFRAVTDPQGVAGIDLPKGRYRLFVSGNGFLPRRLDGELSQDVTVRTELDVDREPSDAEVWS